MATKTQKPKLRVQNISCVIPQTQLLGGLYVGNTYGAENSDILREYGIRAVLTTSIQTPVNYDPVAIPFHLKIEAHDKENYSIIEHLQQCLKFIHKCRQITNVFVHCYAGVSRSITIVVAYIMKYWKWNLKNTLQFVQLKRVVAKPNDGFMQQLKRYQQTIFGTQKVLPAATVLSSPHHNPNIINAPSIPNQANIQNLQATKLVTNQTVYQQPNIPHLTRHQSAFQTHNVMKNHGNNMVMPNFMEASKVHPGAYTSNILEASMYKKHKETPIPKILMNKAIQKSADFRSPNLSPALQKYNSQTSSQIKYGQAVAHSNYQTNNIQSSKSNKGFIRPKDLPGYKH